MEGALQKGGAGCLYVNRLLNGMVRVRGSWSLLSPSAGT